jgi:hypothetical protein
MGDMRAGKKKPSALTSPSSLSIVTVTLGGKEYRDSVSPILPKTTQITL